MKTQIALGVIILLAFASTTFAQSTSITKICNTTQTPLETVYVGHSITLGTSTVELNDLSYPNSNGVSDAVVSVYEGNVLTNQSVIAPYSSAKYSFAGKHTTTTLTVHVKETFPGLYAYQKWAQIKLTQKVCIRK